jgi:hypothetical protein
MRNLQETRDSRTILLYKLQSLEKIQEMDGGIRVAPLGEGDM